MSNVTTLKAAQLAVARAKRSHGTPEDVKVAEHNLRKVRVATRLASVAEDFATLNAQERSEVLETLYTTSSEETNGSN